ncbi:MAG: vWA domain-containing protein, partial [Gudongella sp.]|nr:vWA domain-containing protein [Gudongella sp.]
MSYKVRRHLIFIVVFAMILSMNSGAFAGIGETQTTTAQATELGTNEYEGDGSIGSLDHTASGPAIEVEQKEPLVEENTYTYNFYVEGVEVPYNTQKIIDGDELKVPEEPKGLESQVFIGWFVKGETEPVVFGTELEVIENKEIEVYAVFEEIVATSINLVEKLDGITIKVSADSEVIPGGTTLSVKSVSEQDMDDFIDVLEESEDIILSSASVFDITLLDAKGKEIQPNGEVLVEFSGIELSNENEEVFAYHIESASSNQEKNAILSKNREDSREVNFNRDEVEKNTNSNIKINDMNPSTKMRGLSFKTNHFSIYIVGTSTKYEDSDNRYEMEVGETLELEEKDRSAGGTWSVNQGSSFANISVDPINDRKATVTAIAQGDVRIRYNIGQNNRSHFYIRINDPNRESYDDITAAEEPVIDPDALAPGTVAANKTAKWVDYNNRIAEITLNVEGMPIIEGSDVILVMDVSGSMSTSDRIGTAQDASIEFIDELLGNGNPTNNRVAFIPFEGNDGGSGNNEVDDVTKGSVNFSYNVSQLEDHVNATIAEGGTNYTAALQKAINYADSRFTDEESRPLYVVFMSDGAPGQSGNSSGDTNWNGTIQAAILMSTAYDATIYTVGIQLNGTGTVALQAISSSEGGVNLYQSVSNMSDLTPVLNKIAGEIKKAGTNAFFHDYISMYFNYYNSAPYDNGDGVYNNDSNNPIVTIDVGNIVENGETFKIYVQLKNEYRTSEEDYPTNSDISLIYDDVDGESAEKDKVEIGDPELSVGYGTIKIKYVLVDASGNFINGIGGGTVGEAFRVFVPTSNYFQDFVFNSSTQLEVEETYSVGSNVPSGYSLYSGETSPKNQELTVDDRNATVEFKVVASPKYTLAINYEYVGGAEAATTHTDTTLNVNDTYSVV